MKLDVNEENSDLCFTCLGCLACADPRLVYRFVYVFSVMKGDRRIIVHLGAETDMIHSDSAARWHLNGDENIMIFGYGRIIICRLGANGMSSALL